MSDLEDGEPTNPIDRFVDRVVIRSTCPVGPCTSHSWVIMRAVAVAFLATMPGLYMINQGFGTVGLIVAVANMLITLNIISTRFDQRITDCPHCSGSSICSSENREECQ
jgi:hypothetical protein